MVRTTYTLTILNGLLAHYPHTVPMTKDEDSFDRSALEAQIRSGDYFATLATRLDDLSEHLPHECANHDATLAATIEELLFLQCHYTVVKKPPN